MLNAFAGFCDSPALPLSSTKPCFPPCAPVYGCSIQVVVTRVVTRVAPAMLCSLLETTPLEPTQVSLCRMPSPHGPGQKRWIALARISVIGAVRRGSQSSAEFCARLHNIPCCLGETEEEKHGFLLLACGALIPQCTAWERSMMVEP
jgi:hypothetical protein